MSSWPSTRWALLPTWWTHSACMWATSLLLTPAKSPFVSGLYYWHRKYSCDLKLKLHHWEQRVSLLFSRHFSEAGGCFSLAGSMLIIPDTVFALQVTWSDIAGLDDVITDLKDTVILPIKKKYLFENSRLLQPPKGKKGIMWWIYTLVFKI